jgi:hypothetical protein
VQAPLQNFFCPSIPPTLFFLLVAHTLIQAITLCSRSQPSNPPSESSSLTLFPPDSTSFRRKHTTTHKPTKLQYRQHGVSQTRPLPSTLLEQHHGDVEIDLNGLLADPSSRCSKEKMHINVVVIGHVDSGKSTTTGKPLSTLDLRLEPRAHIHNRSFDLQVRRYRQAYHREVREGKNSTSPSPLQTFLALSRFLPLGGARSLPAINDFLRPDIFGATTSVVCCPKSI